MFVNLNQRLAIGISLLLVYGAILAKALTRPAQEVGLFLMVSCALASIVISALHQRLRDPYK